MAGQRQPTDLVVMKGKKHLTKAEIEARKNSEVIAPCDKVRAPTYLTPDQKKQFRKISKELLQIGLVANVDCDSLARLIISQSQYVEVTEQIRNTPLMVEIPVYTKLVDEKTGEESFEQTDTKEILNEVRDKLMIIQDRCLKQCRQGAADFGLTVSSRCRLIVPKAKESKPENKFAKYGC